MDEGQRQRGMWTGGVALAAILVVAVAAAAIGTWGTTNDETPLVGSPGESAALRSFDECDTLLGELQATALAQLDADRDGLLVEQGLAVDDFEAGGATRSSGADTASPPAPTTTAPGAEASGAAEPGWGGTNIQEVGVDEPDVWKTDGERLLVVDGSTLRAIDLSGAGSSIVGELALPNGGGQLLVDGDVALVVGDGSYVPMERREYAPPSGSTGLVAVDVSDPASMAIIGQSTLEGYLVSARLVDGMARIVTSSGSSYGYIEPAADVEADIRETTIDTWLPRYEVTSEDGAVVDEGTLSTCDQVYVAAEPADASMINVVSLDLRAEELRPVAGTSVVGAGSIVYASPTSVYVAGYAYDTDTGAAATDVHKFATPGREPASYAASARVEGGLLNQFSMSEHDGDLRVAVTADGGSGPVGPMPAPEVGAAIDPAVPVTTIVDDELVPDEVPIAPPVGSSESRVVVLREEAGGLREIGRVGGLGRTEQIYSVRFMGDVGYVVTFRRTDPLYTLDLSDPANPQVVGELKIPGYSSYLHPVGDGLLLGIGQDADELGRVGGFQIALFDVSDLARPQQLQKLVVANGSSIAEDDHHAFTWWAEGGLAMVPLDGLSVFSVDPAGIAERGRITHPTDEGRAGRCVPGIECDDTVVLYESSAIQRSLVVGDDVVTLSSAGVKLSSVDSFADVAWLPFA